MIKIPASSRMLGSSSQKRLLLDPWPDPIPGEERPLAGSSKNVPEHWVGTQKIWFVGAALPTFSCVVPGEVLHLSESQNSDR